MARKYAQQTGSSRGSKILVVDDSPDVLESTRRLLENEGHEVDTVSNGKTALEYLEKQSAHVMLVDYFMPAMTGEELVRRIRESGNSLTQIILVTGYSGEKPARVMMQQLDIQGYHDKSEGAQKLLLWVDTAIKAYRHVLAMEKHRKGLRFILDITPDLHRMQPIDELLEALLWQIEALLGAENCFVATLTGGSPEADEEQGADNAECFIALADTADPLHDLQIRAGTGRYHQGGSVRKAAPEAASIVDAALASLAPYSDESCTVVPLVLGKRSIGIIYLDRRTGYAKDRELLEVFASQAAAAIQNALLYDMATTDPLTGTYMRGFATQQLEHSIKRSIRRSDPVSLLMVDLDRFKQINDDYGHQAGDRALAAVGDLLRLTVRETDIVGRYGGDEFMVILPETSPDGAMIVAERLLTRAGNLSIDVEGTSVPIRLSVGIGSLLQDDPEEEVRVEREQVARVAERLIGTADRALYAAKSSGRAGEMPALKWAEFCFALASD